MTVTKDRTSKYQDATIEKPGEDLGRELAAWLSEGVKPALAPKKTPEKKEAPKSKREPKAEPTSTKGVRPADPEVVKGWIARKCVEDHANATASPAQRGLAAGVIELCFANSTDSKQDRHLLQEYLTGAGSMKDMADAYVLSLLDWLKPTKDDGGAYLPDAMAEQEAQKIREVALVEAGQQQLPLA